MGTGIIEVVIGLVLAYSLLSLIVSQFNNLFLYMLKYRSSFLVDRMKKVLPSLADTVLKHPLIGALSKDGKNQGVEWIKSEHVVNVLLQLFEKELRTSTKGPATEFLQSLLSNEAFTDLRKIILSSKGLLGDDLAATLDKMLQEDGQKAVIDKISAFEISVMSKISDARLTIESWVNARFDNMSNLYKQHMYVLSWIVGLLLAMILNVDTLFMARTLWKEPALRTSVVDTANQIAEREFRPGTEEDSYDDTVAAIQSSVETLLNTNLPIGWAYNPLDADYSGTADASAQSIETDSTLPGYDPRADGRNAANILALNWAFIGIKFIGWILTAFALSLGTDFWFNLLRNLTGQRSSSEKKEG